MSKNAICHEVNVDMNDPTRYEAGAFHFVYRDNKKVGIVHGCPCGCHCSTVLFFRGLGIDGADEWDVNGEWPNVTLRPSIGINKKLPNSGSGPWHWHGFLENGIFVEG